MAGSNLKYFVLASGGRRCAVVFILNWIEPSGIGVRLRAYFDAIRLKRDR